MMSSKNGSRQFVLMGAIFAGVAVAAGAFGAHLLKPILDTAMLSTFETAARYQMYHSLALCIVGWANDRYPHAPLAAAGWFFTAGIVLFSGSLYGLSLTGVRWLGALTPVGGAALIAGWGLFARGLWKTSSS